MARKIAFLINPISGTKNKSSLKELISSATAAQGIDFEILATSATGDYAFLKEKILNDSITDVVICGGDGSVSAICAYLIGLHVNIGIIPLGSGNGLAFCAGIPDNVSKALKIIYNGKASYIDGFYINEVFACMLCGLGADAQVAHNFASSKKRGLISYIKISIKAFFSSRPYAFEVMTQKHHLTSSAYFISIANSNQFGNHVTIAPAASLSDGLLDIVMVKKISKWILPFYVIRQIAGFNNKSLHNSKIAYFQTAELTILNTDSAPLHIDGEPVDTAKKLNISVIPNAIRLIQP